MLKLLATQTSIRNWLIKLSNLTNNLDYQSSAAQSRIEKLAVSFIPCSAVVVRESLKKMCTQLASGPGLRPTRFATTASRSRASTGLAT